MEIIDGHVHLWARNQPSWPWDQSAIRALGPAAEAYLASYTVREMTPEAMLNAMTLVGVDAAVVVSPFITYGFDPSYAVQAAARYPGRFGVVAQFDPVAADVESRIQEWRKTPGALGARIVIPAATSNISADGTYGRLFRAAQKCSVPVCIFAPGSLLATSDIAKSYPDLQLVVDHLGMPPSGDPAWRGLPELLALASFPNVAVKASAVPVHSVTGYPFPDLWPALHTIIDAFGIDRIIWGSDWTRVHAISYADGLKYITESSELSRTDKERILARNLRRIFCW